MNKQEGPPIAKIDEVFNLELSKETNEPVKRVRVFIAAIAINLSAISVGNSMGWTSPIGPKLADAIDSPLDYPIDRQTDAWVSSIVAIGASITPFIAGLLADIIGRKKAILCSGIIFIIAYIMMVFAAEVWIMLLGRLTKGFGIGFVMSVIPMYVGEIATDDVRGAAGSLLSFFIAIGIFTVQCIGPYVSYYKLQYFCIAVPVVFLIVFSFMPESPYFCIAQGQRVEAQRALQFLRGQSAEAVQKELIGIETMVQTSMTQKGTFADIVKSPVNRKALLISLGLITFQQVSGINAVVFNSQSIFRFANTGLDAAKAAIVVTTIQVIISGLTPLFADRFGRKQILLTSACFMGIGLAGLGCFFVIKEMGYEMALNWLPLPSLILYIIMFGIGFGPVPWAILGEMFAPNIKPIASSLGASTCWVVGFFVALFYPTIQAWGVYYAFFLFALLCVVAFFFTIFIVMETRGLSLQEIQNRLNKSK